MSRRVLLDTGPLVSFLDRRDRYHEWAKVQFAQFTSSFLSCEAVVTEACFLVRSVSRGSQAVMDVIRKGLVAIPFRLDPEVGAIAELMTRYANVPMSLADGCLVRMAEQYSNSVVLTLDRHFRLYRKHGRQVIPTILPAGL